MSKEMTPKDALRRISGFISFCCYEYFDKELEKDWKKDIDAITQALERLELLKKENEELTNTIAETHYKMVRYKKFIDFLKINFNIVLDSKLRISDDLECVQTFVYDLPKNTTIKDMFEIIEEVLENGGN